MAGLEHAFSRLGNLPCSFTIHSDAGVTRVGTGEPAFTVHLHNGHGTRALQSLDELTIAEAYVRGDIEIEGDVIRAMWLRDILSDGSGYSFHRFQIFAWTIVLGIIFVSSVYNNLVMPEFSPTLLGLMGLSAGTYIGFKFPEQK